MMCSLCKVVYFKYKFVSMLCIVRWLEHQCIVLTYQSLQQHQWFIFLQIFRETKESELQNLLKARRGLESRLAKLGHVTPDENENSSRIELSIGTILFIFGTMENSIGCSGKFHFCSMRNSFLVQWEILTSLPKIIGACISIHVRPATMCYPFLCLVLSQRVEKFVLLLKSIPSVRPLLLRRLSPLLQYTARNVS